MKRKLLIVLLAVISALCLIGFMACRTGGDGVGGSSSLDGTYYVYRNEKHEKDNWIKISGSNWEDDDGVGGALERNGNALSFKGTVFGVTDEIYSGTYVSDGVLKIKVFGADIYYCKEGITPSASGTGSGGGQTNPAQKYTVTYDANGGEFADGNTFTQEVEANSLLTAPTQPKRTRYTFGGWAKNKNGQDLWQFATDKVTGNITLYAVWQEPSASILSVEGASIEDEQILMIVPPETDKVSLANKVICSSDSSWKLYFDSMGQTEIPTRIAAGLNGSLSNGDNEFYIVVTSANQSQVNTYKLIVHRQCNVTVNYYDNKNNSINTQTVLTGETFDVTYTPTITGYNFNYWQYQNGDKYQPVVIFEGLSLYANTTAKTYKITLNVNNGDELSSNEKTVTYDKSYSLPKPTRTGYTFLGWGYKNGNDLLTDNKGASLKNWTGTTDTTLYAKWQINQYKVTLNKDLEAGGSVSGGGDFDYNSSCTITASTNSGYTWLGWYKGNEQITTELSYKFKMGFDVTYTAKWIACPVTLERSDSAAGTVSGVEKTVLGAQTTITAKTNLGYTFVGWYKGDDQLTTELTYTFKLEETPVTYTAKWIKVTLAKNFTDAGTITPLDKTYKAGESVTVTAGATKLGYTWLGWYNNETELTTDLSYTFDMPKESVTYTAKWEYDKALSNFIFTSTQDTCVISGIKDNGVDTIIVPDYVTEIKSGTFKGCSKVESITLPFVGGSIKTKNDTYQYPFGYIFGTSSYVGASAVKQYYYGNSTSSTTNSTYYIPDSLKTVTITGGNILYGAFYGCTSLTSITISNSVTSIGDMAFQQCRSLTNITISNSVTSIGYNAFDGCRNLESITIPDSVTSIGDSAFSGCIGLTGVYITDLAAWCNIEFHDSYANPLYYAHNLYLNNNLVNEITADMLQGVTEIKSYAFSDCTSLTSITIPDSVTSIGNWAFSGCTSLTSITIPDSVTSIGDWAFGYCENLTNVTIGSNVTSIGNYAFYDCKRLTGVYITDFTAWCNIEFGSSDANPLYYAHNLYLNDELIKNITADMLQGITSIGGSAFSGCTGLTSITIPDSVTSIGGSAFIGCTSLTSITIPDSVTYIGDSAFYNTAYYNNKENWQNGVLYIGNYLIDANSTLSGSYTVNEDTKVIAAFAFWYCSITSITIPDSVTSIGVSAFYGCTSLKSVTIKNTTGWKVSKNSDMRNAIDITVTGDTAKNARLLTDTYDDCYWRRYDA